MEGMNWRVLHKKRKQCDSALGANDSEMLQKKTRAPGDGRSEESRES